MTFKTPNHTAFIQIPEDRL